MSDLDDLIRTALATGDVVPSAADPVTVLRGRVRRARQRFVAGAAVAIFAVAAVVVPLALSGGGSGPSSVTTPATTAPKVGSAWLHDAEDVTVGSDGAGGAAAWALVPHGYGADVVELDGLSGAVERRIYVPGPVAQIAFGLGQVWAFGGGDGGYSSLSVIDRIDPATGALKTLRIHGSGAPLDMAFTDGGAFVSLGFRGAVARIGGASGDLAVTQEVDVPHQPGPIAATSDGTLWVQETLGRSWAQLSVTGGVSRVLQTVSWSGRMFGLSHGNVIWTTDSARRVVEIEPTYLTTGVSVSYGNRIPTTGRPSGVATIPGSGAIYVATSAGLAYYSPRAVHRWTGPTSQLRHVSAQRIAADPDGGVVYLTGAGTVKRWGPPVLSSTS